MTSKIYLNQVLPVEIFRIIDEFLFYDLYSESIVSHNRSQKILSDEELSYYRSGSSKFCHYCRDYFEGEKYFNCRDYFEGEKYFNHKYYLCDSCSKYHERCNFLLMSGKHSFEMKKINIPQYLEGWRQEKEDWFWEEGISTTDKIKYWKKKEKRDNIRDRLYSGIESRRGNPYITGIEALRVDKLITALVDGDDPDLIANIEYYV
jgi:hypothetical protein